MRMLWCRTIGFLRGRGGDRELDDEVRFHLEMLIDRYIREGMSGRDARAAALREFGGVTQMKEAYRDQRSLPWLETLVHDARYGVRSLFRTPAFTLAALVTLALGIGANTAIYSVVNAVLLRPLPYPEPDRIVQLVRRTGDGDSPAQLGARYLFFRDNLRSLEGLAAWRGTTGFNLSSADSAEFVKAMPVSKEFFQVFGVRPEYGDTFTDEQDRPGGPDVVVLSHGLWTRLFGANPSVVGTAVTLGDRSHTVVGVMPRSFVSLPPADLYIPLRPSTTGPGGGFNYAVAGRVRHGITVEQADAEATSLHEALSAAQPQHTGKFEKGFGLVPYQASSARYARPGLLIMLGAVGMLFLIACANTANLMLARASGREREIAVRAALGAGRARLVRQLLTESVILFVAGGALGILLAYFAVPALLSLTPSYYTNGQDVRIDATVLAVMLAVSVSTGVLFGLAPALSLSRHDLADAFKDGTRTTATHRSAWLRGTLVVTEVALCMALLVGAGLLVQTFVRIRAIDPGFDPHGILTARMSLQGDRYGSREALNNFFDTALERIRRIPGVQAASVVNGVPIERGLNMNVDVIDGPEHFDGMATVTDWRYASLDYFKTMGIPIVSGRGFTDGDRAGAPPVVVVSEEFARRFFKNTNPIGHHIGMFKTDESLEVVGVAKDLREGGDLTRRPMAVMYVPVTQANMKWIRTSHAYFPVSWVVRSSNTGAETVRQIREAVRLVDSKQPFSSFVTMEQIKANTMSDRTFQMTLLTIFAGIGLLLATAGIYGLIAYSVAQRTRELGIRMALGASRLRILRSVVRQGVLLALTGVAAGTIAAAWLTRLLTNFVFGVSTLDPITFAGVGLLLVLVAAAASFVPALRAVRLNPVGALRE
jgi:putative ABC transport system permease protein